MMMVLREDQGRFTQDLQMQMRLLSSYATPPTHPHATALASAHHRLLTRFLKRKQKPVPDTPKFCQRQSILPSS